MGPAADDKVFKNIDEILNRNTTPLGRFFIAREQRKADKDRAVFGTSYLKQSHRRAYNPMCWLLGSLKIKRLDPKRYINFVNWGEYFKEI